VPRTVFFLARAPRPAEKGREIGEGGEKKGRVLLPSHLCGEGGKKKGGGKKKRESLFLSCPRFFLDAAVCTRLGGSTKGKGKKEGASV